MKKENESTHRNGDQAWFRAGADTQTPVKPVTTRLLQTGCTAAAALGLLVLNANAATITHEITHQWATDYAGYVSTVALPAIPRFNPAVGTLTAVSFTLAAERRTEYTAAAPFGGGSYTLGATSIFSLYAPELSGLPTRLLASFSTPEKWVSGYLQAGESVSGTLISNSSSNGIVTTQLERFTQTNQFFVLSNYGSDGGLVGYGGGAGFSTLIRHASATVTVLYQYAPAAPLLQIAPAEAGKVGISWIPTTAGFILQEASSLNPANWTDSASGTNNTVVVPAAGSAKFYRLFLP